jgi:hypothetical protein
MGLEGDRHPPPPRGSARRRRGAPRAWAEVVVLSQGILEALQVCPETLELLKQRDIPPHVLQTEQAMRLYNELAGTQRAAGLFHSIC